MIQLGNEPVISQRNSGMSHTYRSFFIVFLNGLLTYYDRRIIFTMTVVVTTVVVR